MDIDLKEKKFTITGLQGTGKTQIAKALSQKYDSPQVFTPHPEDYTDVKTTVYNPNANEIKKEFEFWIKTMKRDKENIDLLIIDEADMLFEGQEALGELKDIVINHRHYNMSLMFITRRPQDIKSSFFEQCEYNLIFIIESPLAKKKFRQIDERIIEKMKELEYGKHKFVFKKIGEKPKIAKLNMDKNIIELK